MVHYLLGIHKLKEEKGYARVTDIAKELELTKGSVSTALNNLKTKGLVEEEENSKFIILTDYGHEEVHRILSSRTLLYYFLKDFVGVDHNIANKDSCAMEHLMSSETSEKLFHLMKDLTSTCSLLDKAEGEIPASCNFKTTQILSNYKNLQEFIEDQSGDTFMPRSVFSSNTKPKN